MGRFGSSWSMNHSRSCANDSGAWATSRLRGAITLPAKSSCSFSSNRASSSCFLGDNPAMRSAKLLILRVICADLWLKLAGGLRLGLGEEGGDFFFRNVFHVFQHAEDALQLRIFRLHRVEVLGEA